ncbi:hypothetical protein FLL45_14665 [Aliikangiella marina]|uniref:Uncharacterized protein n=2 Tax=Aliikangiella marina TaxID=1712262 RepID=A0A545TA57_9GAMM|nr:DUF6678 family protein [Aliikangiella marina]TQV74096.1 hypothetical protein FLL45_14665 [Aliikangiella marina]
MSDTKWEKIIDRVTDVVGEVFVNYKLIYSEEVYDSSLDSSDFKPFFIEPTLYKEVEWLEFPYSYCAPVNRNNLKAGTKTYDQDVAAIKDVLDMIGRFDLEQSQAGLKIYGYR